MRSIITAATLAAAILPLTPAAAQSIPGYAASATRLHAGPLRDFPDLRTVRRGAKLAVHGCLRDWTWCDVTSGGDRGWIAGKALRVVHQGRRRPASDGMGIGVTTFSFGAYWADHYPGRPFYDQRERWQLRSDRAYRPEWGAQEQRKGSDPKCDCTHPHDRRQNEGQHGQDLRGDTREMEEQSRLSGERGDRPGEAAIQQYSATPYRFPDHGSGSTTKTENPKSAGPAPDPE